MKEKGIMDFLGETTDIIDGSLRAEDSKGANSKIHDSQPYSSREMMKISPMFGYEDPPPMRWVVDGIIPYNYVTILGGDGGTGKSFLALELMHAVATGSPFLGQPVEETNVLYVDFELQEEDQRRRWNRLLKGKGIDQHAESIKDRVYFIKPQVSLSAGKLTEELIKAVEEYNAGLVIIDSLTIGLGGDATNQEVITKVMQSLDRLSTVVALDHLTHNQRRSNLADASVYGSVMKRNGARSMLILGKAEGGGIVLRQNKTNFGEQRDIICYEMVFSQDETGPVTFETRSLTDTAMAGATQSLSSTEITLLAIQDICKDGATASAEHIAAWREARGHGISPDSVRNQLGPLRSSNRIVRHGANSWKPASSNSSQSPSLRAVNSENADSTGIPLFDVGSRVITPDGPGSIADSTLSAQGRFAVRLDGNAQYETHYYSPEQLQWISDEGSPPMSP